MGGSGGGGGDGGAYGGTGYGGAAGGYAGQGASYGLGGLGDSGTGGGYTGNAPAAGGRAGPGATSGLGELSSGFDWGALISLAIDLIAPAASIIAAPAFALNYLAGDRWGAGDLTADPNAGSWGEGGYGQPGQPGVSGISGQQAPQQGITAPQSSYGLDYSSLAQGLVGKKEMGSGYKRLGSEAMTDEGYLSMIRELAQGI